MNEQEAQEFLVDMVKRKLNENISLADARALLLKTNFEVKQAFNMYCGKKMKEQND